MYAKKIVSCFLTVVFVMHCATFSSYSVPTSSVPTLAVPTSSVPNEETFPELSGGDGEVQYCIEVPEVITFYTNTYDMKARLKYGFYYEFRERYTISCTKITEGYFVCIFLNYKSSLSDMGLMNSFSLDYIGFPPLVFSAKGKQELDCGLQLQKSLFDLEEDETREFGKVFYRVTCKPLNTLNNASDVPNNQSDI